MKNKKSIMAISALLILYFHLWVNLTMGEAELFLKQIAYVGVDMFFFVSAYSLSSMKTCNYLSDYFGFIFKRFKSVYVKYVLFAVTAAIVSSWSIVRLIKALFYVELFTKGGGAFLWFLPAIMLFYIAFPLFKLCDERNRTATLVATVIAFIVISIFVTNFTDYKSMFIFWNRIPVFLIGYYCGISTKFLKFENDKLILSCCGVVLTAIGVYLGIKLGYKIRLQVPFRDMFYIAMIPLTLGLVIFTGMIKENKIIKWIGSSTLEMYGIQMIFGYKIANAFVKLFGIKGVSGNVALKLCCNVCIFLVVIFISVILHYGYALVEGRLRKDD